MSYRICSFFLCDSLPKWVKQILFHQEPWLEYWLSSRGVNYIWQLFVDSHWDKVVLKRRNLNSLTFCFSSLSFLAQFWHFLEGLWVVLTVLYCDLVILEAAFFWHPFKGTAHETFCLFYSILARILFPIK